MKKTDILSKITEVITLNERKSRIALIIVLALLMQIIMPIMNVYAYDTYNTGISEVNASTPLQKDKLRIEIRLEKPNTTETELYKVLLIQPEDTRPYGAKTIDYYQFDLADYIKLNYEYIPNPYEPHYNLLGEGLTSQYNYMNYFYINVDHAIGMVQLNINLTPSVIQLDANNTIVTVGAAQANNNGNVEPNLTVKYDSTTLTKDTDYTISYSNNNKKGQAKATITGTGSYEGSFDVPFTIYGISLTGRDNTQTNYIATTGTEITLPTIPQRDGYDSVWKSGNTEIVGGGKYTVTSSDINFTIKDIIRTIAFDDNFVINISNPENLQYTGNKVIPEVTLTYNGEDLDESQFVITTNDDFTTVGEKNYTIALKDGSTYNLGESTTTSKDFTAVLQPKDLNVTVEIQGDNFVYSGDAIRPNIVVKNGNEIVSEDEYIVTYGTNTNAGEGTITVSDKTGGNYNIIQATKNFTINPKPISNPVINVELDSYTYTGSQIKPNITVKDENGNLIPESQYDIIYGTNKNVGENAGTIKVKPKTGSNYSFAEKTVNFDITAKEVTNPTITYTIDNSTFDGTAKEPVVVVKDDNNNLISADEYDVTYENNVNAGTATIKVKSKDGANYTFEDTTTFTIDKESIDNSGITVTIGDTTYTGEEIKPTVEVKDANQNIVPESNYTVTYKNNVNFGTATMTIKSNDNSNYNFEYTTTYEIKQKEIQSPKVTSASEIYEKTGEEIKPTIVVKDEEGIIISEDQYEITYENNIDVGTGKIIIKSKDNANYKFSTTKEFTIKEPGTITNKTINENVLKANIKNSDSELQKIIPLTEEERIARANGKNIYTFIEVSNISNSVSEEDKRLINNKLDDKSEIGMYLDINLFKQVEGEEKVKISETTEKVKISIEVPAELLNTASNITRKFYILTVHNGIVKNIETELDGNILTFETDAFSTYALAYTDTVIESKDNNSSNPITGDNITLWISLLFVSMAGIVGTKKLTRKKKRVSKH